MPPEVPKWTPYGEEDEKEEEDTDKRSCDKLSHFLRSLFNQPNHKKVASEILKEDRVMIVKK